jgi:sulfate transport system ATP-binding protein
MTVADNISFGLRMRKRSERPPRRRSARASTNCCTSSSSTAMPGACRTSSRGAAPARGPGPRPRHPPAHLLLDEPFGALDAKVRKELRRWLRQFHNEIGLTTVFVTHDQEEALELADEVVVMNKARVEQRGSPQDVFDYPESRFVIEFMGSVNRVVGGMGNVKIPKADHLYVRPHDIQILPETGRTGVDARVLHIFSAGNVGRVTLEREHTHEVMEAEVPRWELENLQLKPGQLVGLRFRHIRLFATGTEGREQLEDRDL